LSRIDGTFVDVKDDVSSRERLTNATDDLSVRREREKAMRVVSFFFFSRENLSKEKEISKEESGLTGGSSIHIFIPVISVYLEEGER
jgi:hypothetical protein